MYRATLTNQSAKRLWLYANDNGKRGVAIATVEPQMNTAVCQ